MVWLLQTDRQHAHAPHSKTVADGCVPAAGRTHSDSGGVVTRVASKRIRATARCARAPRHAVGGGKDSGTGVGCAQATHRSKQQNKTAGQRTDSTRQTAQTQHKPHSQTVAGGRIPAASRAHSDPGGCVARGASKRERATAHCACAPRHAVRGGKVTGAGVGCTQDTTRFEELFKTIELNSAHKHTHTHKQTHTHSHTTTQRAHNTDSQTQPDSLPQAQRRTPSTNAH